jgi:hypothetical protein
VLGLGEVLGLETGLVTFGADGSGLRRTQRFEADDLGDVTTAIHMGLRGAMARLTAMLAALEQRRMRGAGKVLLPNLLMAGLAHIGVGVLAAARAGNRG